ncbi:hypothetical protein [Candidatus Mycoplasma haematohominis]|uniref:Uncharacterized protein n=1 Tax=Candidatus Mycoplasma haematohominis TaxID=1494318 RepID=A0A478FSV7_9MOLU|nr:hypothetical protein [Candidatus Mycoplasma haemohominis]GCE63090.1 hypothetical protein MHSWG343_00680 [Candidatus Mycoplasma haemohominis]
MASSGALAAAGVLGAGAIGATSVGTYYAINKPGNETNPTLVNPADQKRNQVQLPETNESVDRLETEDAGDTSQLGFEEGEGQEEAPIVKESTGGESHEAASVQTGEGQSNNAQTGSDSLETNSPTGQTSPVEDVALTLETSNLSQVNVNGSDQTGVQSDASNTVNLQPETISTKDTGSSSDSN